MPGRAPMPVHCDHDHQHCIDSALDEAERVCAREGARLTPLRRRVLEAVWQDHEAVKAYDLIDRLSSEDRTVKPPTVYRALDFLLEHGLIHRVESLNAFIGCARPSETHAFQVLICRRCGRTEEFERRDVAETLRAEAERHGFSAEHQIIEVKGLCPACRQEP